MPKPLPLHVHDGQVLIDNSTLSTIGQCPRQAYYSAGLKLKKSDPRPALHFGASIHEALAARYTQPDCQIMTAAIEAKMVDAFIEHHRLEPTPEGEYRNLAYGVDLIEAYNSTYTVDTFKPIPLDDGPAVELPIAIHVADVPVLGELWVTDPDINSGEPYLWTESTIPVYLTGKIDLVVKQDGGLWIVDHKTTSMGGSTVFDEFYISTQFKGYAYAVQNLLGLPIRGVIINLLVCRRPTKTGKGFTFDRCTIPYHPDLIIEWQHTFPHLVLSWINYHIASSHTSHPSFAFPQQTSWCSGKYGRCSFYDICQLTPSHRQALIDSPFYVPDDWTPLADTSTTDANIDKNPMPPITDLFSGLID